MSRSWIVAGLDRVEDRDEEALLHPRVPARPDLATGGDRQLAHDDSEFAVVLGDQFDERGAVGIEQTQFEDRFVHHDGRRFERRAGAQEDRRVDRILRRLGDRRSHADHDRDRCAPRSSPQAATIAASDTVRPPMRRTSRRPSRPATRAPRSSVIRCPLGRFGRLGRLGPSVAGSVAASSTASSSGLASVALSTIGSVGSSARSASTTEARASTTRIEVDQVHRFDRPRTGDRFGVGGHERLLELVGSRGPGDVVAGGERRLELVEHGRGRRRGGQAGGTGDRLGVRLVVVGEHDRRAHRRRRRDRRRGWPCTARTPSVRAASSPADGGGRHAVGANGAAAAGRASASAPMAAAIPAAPTVPIMLRRVVARSAVTRSTGVCPFGSCSRQPCPWRSIGTTLEVGRSSHAGRRTASELLRRF